VSVSSIRSRDWSGSRSEHLSWGELVALFDSLFGSDEHDLASYPARIGWMSVKWTDALGDEHSLARLEDLEQPYTEMQTGTVLFSRQRDGNANEFAYWPGPPRPRAEGHFRGSPEAIDAQGSVFDASFPDPFDGPLIFVSWGGDESRAVAEVLAPMLTERFPDAEVFFSETSIDPGEDPLHEIFEEGLLRAKVVVAVLTKDSSTRPWVIWEMATAWARDALLVPIFVNVTPGEIHGPLTLKTQGVPFDDATKLDRAFRTIADKLKRQHPKVVNAVELHDLIASATS
jgi:hypothetical protein